MSRLGTTATAAQHRALPRWPWQQGRAWLIELGIAVAALLYSLLLVPGPGGVSIAVALCVPFVVARSRPWWAFGGILGVAFLQTLLGIDVLPANALLAGALFWVAARTRWWASALAGLGVLGWIGLSLVPRADALFLEFRDLLLLVVIVVLAWSWGTFARARRAHQEGERERAVQQERTRIARELHDIVSHGLSAVVLLAEGAATTVDSDPARAREAMLRVRDTGRTSLTEMRRMLAVLRDEQAAGGAPQPGLADLPALVEAAGLPVELTVSGTDQALSPGLELTVYRLIQEALTNVRTHARGVRAVAAVVECGPQAVTVRISDDGEGPAAGSTGGRGLVGMRERVAAYAGTLRAGPAATGGFEVEAVLPIGGTS